MIKKIFWIFRAFLYFPFLGGIKYPSYIGKPILILGLKKIKLGKRVRIYPNVRIEVHGINSKLIIEDNVGIAQNVHITTASELNIKSGATILANVFVTDIDHEYKNIDEHILDQPFSIKKTEIGENCFIGIGAAIQAGTILGNQCIVGANSVVRGVFPDYCVIVGTPARIIKRYNESTKKWERTNSKGDFI